MNKNGRLPYETQNNWSKFGTVPDDQGQLAAMGSATVVRNLTVGLGPCVDFSICLPDCHNAASDKEVPRAMQSLASTMNHIRMLRLANCL